MLTDVCQLDRSTSLRGRQQESGVAKPVRGESLSADVSLYAQPEPHDGRVCLFGHLRHHGVVTVENSRAVRRECVDQLCLRVSNRTLASELADVGGSYA